MLYRNSVALCLNPVSEDCIAERDLSTCIAEGLARVDPDQQGVQDRSSTGAQRNASGSSTGPHTGSEQVALVHAEDAASGLNTQQIAAIVVSLGGAGACQRSQAPRGPGLVHGVLLT